MKDINFTFLKRSIAIRYLYVYVFKFKYNTAKNDFCNVFKCSVSSFVVQFTSAYRYEYYFITHTVNTAEKHLWYIYCIPLRCNVLECICNGRVDSSGYGECQKESRTAFPGRLFCYIDSPMGCSDSHTLTHGFKPFYVSAKGCMNQNDILTRISNQG